MLFTDWRFIFFVNLVVHSLGSPKCRFEFPNFKDHARMQSDNGEKIVVEFRAESSCNTSEHGNLAYFVGKEVNGVVGQNCIILLAQNKCEGNCTCPTEGSDLYRLVLKADPVNNGTWTWSSQPYIIKDRSIDILIEDGENSAASTPRSITLSVDTVTSSDTVPAHDRDTFVKNVKHSNDEFSFPAAVAIGVSVSAVVFVSVILAVICRLRYNMKAVVSRRPRTTVHDLYRGSNVSMTVNNELYVPCHNLHNHGASAQSAGSSGSLEGDYAEIESLQQAAVGFGRPSCRPPPLTTCLPLRSGGTRESRVYSEVWMDHWSIKSSEVFLQVFSVRRNKNQQ